MQKHEIVGCDIVPVPETIGGLLSGTWKVEDRYKVIVDDNGPSGSMNLIGIIYAVIPRVGGGVDVRLFKATKSGLFASPGTDWQAPGKIIAGYKLKIALFSTPAPVVVGHARKIKPFPADAQDCQVFTGDFSGWIEPTSLATTTQTAVGVFSACSTNATVVNPYFNFTMAQFAAGSLSKNYISTSTPGDVLATSIGIDSYASQYLHELLLKNEDSNSTTLYVYESWMKTAAADFTGAFSIQVGVNWIPIPLQSIPDMPFYIGSLIDHYDTVHTLLLLVAVLVPGTNFTAPSFALEFLHINEWDTYVDDNTKTVQIIGFLRIMTNQLGTAHTAGTKLIIPYYHNVRLFTAEAPRIGDTVVLSGSGNYQYAPESSGIVYASPWIKPTSFVDVGPLIAGLNSDMSKAMRRVSYVKRGREE